MSVAALPRIAGRGLVMYEGQLLLVNAWPGGVSDLWCAPGGGQRLGESLPACVEREVHEETGLQVRAGPPCLVNEFHDPGGRFHQVEIFFRCRLADPGVDLPEGWEDPDAVVTERRWVTQAEAEALWIKPDSLRRIAWARGIAYDPLEPFVK